MSCLLEIEFVVALSYLKKVLQFLTTMVQEWGPQIPYHIKKKKKKKDLSCWLI